MTDLFPAVKATTLKQTVRYADLPLEVERFRHRRLRFRPTARRGDRASYRASLRRDFIAEASSSSRRRCVLSIDRVTVLRLPDNLLLFEFQLSSRQ